ncbi:hypothetical protein IVB18_06095 [Bradyrhizobium sp. 186]|uniref:hypothetical protein n=1 Tax=Bradyrhizobium sp. 186 TaxID=2782654 RepID=UPI0020013212|nr:hypothetical protein [Bradyrhizobium sp. 186]UPK40749.1 hypothetical protein IVB18_06095 [Bradyrhizobium sp. 186]
MASDAFDKWHQWREKSPDDRLSITAELYHAVMRLPATDQLDREKVNEAAQEVPETVWIYEDGHKHIGDVDWVKVFASEDAANEWLAANDPGGVAWAYPIEPER